MAILSIAKEVDFAGNFSMFDGQLVLLEAVFLLMSH